MTQVKQPSGVIYWFRNDLRLHDQAALCAAIQLAKSHQTWLLPVYIHDAALDVQTAWGFNRTGPHRKAWLRMAIKDVSQQLASMGSQLLQLEGDPTILIENLSKSLDNAWVVCEEIAAPFEQDQIGKLREAGTVLQTHWLSTLMAVKDLPLPPAQLPDQFTQFRQQVEKPGLKVATPFAPILSLPKLPKENGWLQGQGLVQDEQPSASIDEVDARSSFPYSQARFQGGERAALQHLQAYCQRMLPSSYKQTRNGLMGTDYSTKWSPWLATGALSARTAWQAIQQFESQHGANDSTYWIGFELLWRDHFRWLHVKHGARLYKQTGLWPALKTNTQHDAAKFEAWRSARTGHPFIDAGMRELNATGYTSNRMRQNLASFLIHDLACDWRAGAAWFEAQLIDYDVYSNQGNWLYLSGQGTDPRGSRRFNPDKQAHDYDPDGAYQRLWSA